LALARELFCALKAPDGKRCEILRDVLRSRVEAARFGSRLFDIKGCGLGAMTHKVAALFADPDYLQAAYSFWLRWPSWSVSHRAKFLLTHLLLLTSCAVT
jgi:hypothetical protein